MSDLGLGVIKTDGAWYRDVDPQATYVVFDTTEQLLRYLRGRFGEFVLDVSEGFMNEVCRYSVYQRPF